MVSSMLLVLACGITGVVALPYSPLIQRVEAQSRWAMRPFASYHITVRVEFAGNTCLQELETSGEHLRRVVSNNCRMSWLSLLTVERLFEIGERLEQPAPCYATVQTCLCHRIRVGDIAYDEQLGYPSILAYRREVRPNLVHIEYWKRLWETRRLPRCTQVDQEVTVVITSLTPLP